MDGGAGNDSITLTSLTGSVTLGGGDGNDAITLTNLTGPVTVDGGAGTDKLIVTGRAAANTFSLSAAALTVNGVVDNFSNVENLAVNGGAAADTFGVAGLSAFPVTFTGGGGRDKLQGPNVANSWAITTATKGTLDSSLSFVNMTNLVGGSDVDTFTLSPGVTLPGKIDGGGGAGNTINYANYKAAVTVNLQTSAATGTAGFANIQSFVGSAKVDTLVGANQTNQWNITGRNAGAVNGTAFTGFENLVGGTRTDTFHVADGASVTGNIDGGKGTNAIDYSGDSVANKVNLQTKIATGMASFVNIQQIVGAGVNTTLVGPNVASTWNITANNAGTVGTTAFSGVGNLTGGTAADTFVLADGAGVSGKINGSGGANSLSYAPYTTPITVDLTAMIATNVGSFANLTSFVGGKSASDTLVGPNQANVWTVSANNAGKVNAISFSKFENLTGSAQADAFVFAKGIGVSGRIDGGSGRNRLDYSAYVTSVVVDLSAGTASNTAGIANIQDVAGGSANDTLTGDSQDNVLLGNGGNDTLVGNDGRDLLFGGDGLDTILGGAGEDVLVNGKTTFDTNWAVLDALRTYWTGGNDFTTRTQKLAAGTTGVKVLPKLNSSTISNDNFADNLTGGSDADWFFAKKTAVADKLLDLLAEDRVN